MKISERQTKVFLLLLVLGVSACTTTSTIITRPPGAKVYLSGQYLGRSPVEAELNDGFVDGADYWVEVKKKGYRDQRFRLQQHWSPGYIVLDILICLPTLGFGCYLVYFNAKTHDSEYIIPLEPVSSLDVQPPGATGVTAPPLLCSR